MADTFKEPLNAEQLYRTGLKLLRGGKPKEARPWYEQAAALGHSLAAERLADPIWDPPAKQSPPPAPVPKSSPADRREQLRIRALATLADGRVREGIALLTQAASLNDPEAQYRLGAIYSKGEKVEKDHRLARYWFTLASGLGHPKAAFSLAIQYELRGDREQALVFYRRAAALGHHPAYSLVRRIDPAIRRDVITDILPGDPDLL